MPIVTIQASSDTLASAFDVNGNYSSANPMGIGETNLRAFLTFDLTARAGQTADASATLRLRDQSGFEAGDMAVYEILRATNDAQLTWNSYSTGNAWADPGADGTGDRSAAPIATLSFPGGGGATRSLTIPQSVIQAAFGGFLRLQVTTSVYVEIVSTEAGSNRPELEYSYADVAVPGPKIDPTIGNGPFAAGAFAEFNRGIPGSGISASLNATLADATLAATAALRVKADLASTLANATLAATTALRIQASANPTLADATLASTAAARIQAAATIALQDATLAASALLRIKADANNTLADVTLSSTVATIDTIDANLVVTLADASLVSTAAARIQASLGVTLQDATAVATAAARIAADASITLANATLAATAAVRLVANAANTLADATLASTATVGNAAAGANLAVTLDPVTLSSTAAAKAQATLVAALADLTASSTARALIAGSLAVTLEDVSLASAAAALIKANASNTLAPVTLTAYAYDGSTPPAGDGDAPDPQSPIVRVGKLLS